MRKPASLMTVAVFATLVLLSCGDKKSEIYSDIFDIQRKNMVRWDLRENGIKSEAVLQAMLRVPRHLFIPAKYRKQAYEDGDIPIGTFVTTPRPYVVAKTIELLDLKGHEKVLEIGTGKGYQSALLAELANEVYTIEMVPELGEDARATLALLGYRNVFSKIGDGFKGWPEHQPFDAILVMASGKDVPQPLLEQLKIGGRLVMPIGEQKEQSLILYRKGADGLRKESVMKVQLKPLEGNAARKAWKRRGQV